MKTYTITVVDNENKKTVLDLEVLNFNFSMNTALFDAETYGKGVEFVASSSELTINASVVLAEPEEKEPAIYELEDISEEDTIEIENCDYGHSYKTFPGFFADYEECEICKARKYTTD